MSVDLSRSSASAGRFLPALVVLVVLALPGVASGQTVDVRQSGATFQVRYVATFSPDELEFGELSGYDTIALAEGGVLNDVGKPMLPTAIVRIALPDGMAVKGVRVTGAKAIPLPGEYFVYPAQPPRRVSDPAGDNDFVGPNRAVYASARAYPARTVEFTQQSDLAGQSFAVLRVCPVQYVPAARRLILNTSIQIVLDGVAGYVCASYLPRRISDAARDAYDQMLAEMVVNPDDVQLRTAGVEEDGSRGVPPGDYDYVIITQDSWVSAFQPLANWKTKKGVPATIVTTSWIYNSGGYSGTNTAKIRAFVIDAYNNWGTTFFLLGGDTDTVPAPSKSFSVDPTAIPNDTYYADFNDNYVCDVHVGRASVTGPAAINTFINKVLTYEKNPPLTDYAKCVGFFGFDLSGSGNEGSICKEAIRTSYLPTGWTYRKVYDTDGGNHRDAVMAVLNQGNNLMNHADHAYTDQMGTGSTNHGWAVYTNDMLALTNGNRQSIGYSMGCWACDYNASQCIAEGFVRNANGGGVAFVGNSRYGWYLPGYGDQYSFRFDRYFYRSLFQQNWYLLGQCFSDHKNDSYQNDEYYRYIFTELTLLGDPELPIWTENPTSVSVAHPATLNVGQANNFTVQVTSGGNPVASATVCLWKAGDVYQTGLTNASGSVSFAVTPASVGTLYVTVTKRNGLPYESTAQVIVGGSTDILPGSFTLVRGWRTYGDLPDLFYSDDARLGAQVGIVLTPAEPPVWLVVTGTATTAAPSELRFTLEANVSTAGAFTQRIQLFNYVTQSFEDADVRPATIVDQTVVVLVSGDPSRFINPTTREMQAQLTWVPSGPISAFPWTVGVDRTVWTITP
ncbi:MAG: C25 family cysteine peptidase [Planctomycetota bacterium]